MELSNLVLQQKTFDEAEKQDSFWELAELVRDILLQGAEDYPGIDQEVPWGTKQSFRGGNWGIFSGNRLAYQSVPANLACKDTLSCLWNLSTMLLDWGWKDLVGECTIPGNLHLEDKIELLNWASLLLVITAGTLNTGIQEWSKILAQRTKWNVYWI